MNRRGFIIGGSAAAIASAGVGFSFWRMGSRSDYDRAVARQRTPLDPDGGLREIVRFAALAANGHNTQPWRFRRDDRAIRITPDLTRRTPAVDPDDHHLYVSLGCAAANLELAAQACGLTGELRFDSAGNGAARYDVAPGAKRVSILCDAIPRRQSTRALYDGRAATARDMTQLAEAAHIPGVDLVLISDRRQIDRVRELVTAGNDRQMSDAAFMAELKHWMRFNPRAALRHGDGLFSGASDNPALPDWLGAPMFDLAFRASSENEKYTRHIASSAGVAVFAGAGASPAEWFDVGRACQRFALQATALGMKVAFINQPVEVAELRPALASLIGMPGRRPDIVIRFGYGPELPMSPRRPVEAILDA